MNEQVMLHDTGSSPLNIGDWFLRDGSGRVWSLVSVGTLDPGQSATIRRNGMPMSLNNDGDIIVLLDAANQEQDRLEYTASVPGQVIQHGQ
jgi:hypothetical protein